MTKPANMRCVRRGVVLTKHNSSPIDESWSLLVDFRILTVAGSTDSRENFGCVGAARIRSSLACSPPYTETLNSFKTQENEDLSP